MRKKDVISRTRMAQILKEELLLNETNEQVLNEHQRLIEERKDFQSLVLEHLLKERYGKQIDIYRIDEGLWDKIKGGLAKMGKFSNLLPGAKMRNVKSVNDLEAAFEKVAGQAVVPALRKYQAAGYPNVESADEFRKMTDELGVMAAAAVGAVLKPPEEGGMPYETAEKIMDLLQKFISNSERQLKSVYTVTNEEQELEEAGLDDAVLSEVNLNWLLRRVEKGKMNPMKALKRIEKTSKGVRALFRDKTKKATYDQIKKIGVEKYGAKAVAQVAPKAAKAGADVAGGVAKAAGEVIDPWMGGSGLGAGYEMGAAGGTYGAAGLAPSTAAAAPVQIVSTIKSSATLKSFLAMFGLTPGIAAAGAAALGMGAWALYKHKKSSRSQQLKDMVKRLVMPSEVTKDTFGVPDAEEIVKGTPEGTEGGEDVLGKETVKDVTGDLEDVKDIYVFKGKGGKGMQSQLAKAGVKGPEMSGLLKGLRADLTDAGFNVLEEAKREVIALTNTLAALEQMADPAQKEAAKKILVQMLRANRVKLGPQDSRALAPAAAAAAESNFNTETGQPQTPKGWELCKSGQPQGCWEKWASQAPPEMQGGAAAGGEAEIAAGDAFAYTSGKGAKSAVKVVTPPSEQSQGKAIVTKIDPNTCAPTTKGTFQANPATLTTPIETCPTEQPGTPAAGGEQPAAVIPGEEDEEAATVKKSQAGYKQAVQEQALLERWHTIAGIIKG